MNGFSKAAGRTAKIVVIAAILLVVGLNAVVTTSAREYKLITQSGQVVRIQDQPGPSIKIPFSQTT